METDKFRGSCFWTDFSEPACASHWFQGADFEEALESAFLNRGERKRARKNLSPMDSRVIWNRVQPHQLCYNVGYWPVISWLLLHIHVSSVIASLSLQFCWN